MRECRGVLTQAGGAVDPGTVCGKMAKLDPGRTTGTSLDRTDANGERPPQRCTTSEQWQRDVFTESECWRGSRSQAAVRSTPQSSPSKETERHQASQSAWEFHHNTRQGVERLDCVSQPETVQHVHQTIGTKRDAEDHSTSSSAKRAHAIPPPVSRILLQSDVGNQFDVGGACRPTQHRSMFRHSW